MAAGAHSLRERMEDALGAWAQVVWRGRWAFAIGMLAVAAAFGSRIPHLEIKTSTEDFLFEGDPVRAAYDAFRAQFGQDQLLMIAVTPGELFDAGFLEKLRALHEELESEVPYLEDITSLVNVRSVYGRGDELVVEDLLEEPPATAAELAALRERVLTTPSYRQRGLVSGDGRSTSIVIELATYSELGAADELGGFDDEGASGGMTRKRPFLTGPENSEVVEAAKRVVARYDGPDFRVQMGGGPMMTHELSQEMAREVPVFFGGALLAIAALLALLFRSVAPVFLCVLVVVPGVIATFGIAATVGIPFSVTSQLLPSFLLAVGVSYTVHLVTIFRRRLVEDPDRRAALEHALRHSGPPIVMTALTTAIGMLSFLAAAMKPIMEMGLLAAVGAAVSLVYALTLLPALLALLPVRAGRGDGTPRLDALLGAMAAASARHAHGMVAITLVLAVGAGVAMTWLRHSSDPMSWFPRDDPYYVAQDFLKWNFGGSMALEVLAHTGRENGLHDPAVMNRLETIERLVERLKGEGAQLSYTVSVADIARETHQALNRNDPVYYALPQERRLLAQEMLLFENSGADDLEQVVDPQFGTARVTVRSLWSDGVYAASFLEAHERDFHEAFGDAGEVEITGMSAVISRTVAATQISMLRSYGLALALITPVMIVLIGSLRAGLVSMVPNLVPIVLTLGLMGATGIRIDMFTLLAGCIAIGLAVDDTIHFISGFRRYLAAGNDPVRAVELTMQSTGRALLFTSIVLTTGFLVLATSRMINLQEVGMLTAFAIGSAFLLDVTVTPALLVLTHRRRV